MNAILRGQFSTAHKKAFEYPIFRGVRGAAEYPYWIVQPAKTYRSSKNTSNFYTGLIDKLPSWREYPKRSRSIICSSSEGNASAFGHLLRVFPKNGSKIGVCPQSDFWDSFKLMMDRTKIYTMDEFNDTFTGIFEDAYKPLGDMGRELTEETYKQFIDLTNQWATKDNIIQKIRTSEHVDNHTRAALVDDINKYFGGDWEKYFDDLMNPTANKFELHTIETYNVKESRDKEVWTDGVCLMIDYDRVGELNGQVDPNVQI
jgi:hypothetical protein